MNTWCERGERILSMGNSKIKESESRKCLKNLKNKKAIEAEKKDKGQKIEMSRKKSKWWTESI